MEQLDLRSLSLMRDMKKLGPDLKEVREKLNKNWVPVWLHKPTDFRSTTKMPNFRLEDGQIKVAQSDYILIPDSASGYRRIWLVIMSLMVCTLGICNSMLMSVTERFKEIGTMKCLGALDKFVVTLFLLESMFLGMIASFLGWFIGFIAMILVAGMSKGWSVIGQISAMDVFLVFIEALAAGALLTVIATIAPAVQAARMPPAAALRVEI
jgi:hypothetical protein